LRGDIECDVAIVGGGISGLNTAYQLKKAGLSVAVLEKNTIASGTTGGTTGKVTVQHGLVYAQLLQRFGKQVSQRYADLSQQAFRDVEMLIKAEAINCDWRREDNFVYTADPKKLKSFWHEATIAADLGLPATFETNLDLPFHVVGAVKFANQAYFNSVKYTRSLAKLVHGNGSYVFEQSTVNKINRGSPCTVKTKQGSVTAKHVIIATKVPPGPLIGRATYAAIEYPVTSYIIAGTYTGGLRGMYISPDKEHYSILPIDMPEGRLLLIGGESHIPGIKRSTPNHRKLAEYMQEWFDIDVVKYRWKAMDYMAYDSLPLVGPLYPRSTNIYFIGGFKKWGLNLSMVAANLMTEILINKNENAADLFSPYRVSAPASIPKAVIEYFK
jgi:glycine/D-amino acid oxidase-like deaminating enzyme